MCSWEVALACLGSKPPLKKTCCENFWMPRKSYLLMSQYVLLYNQVTNESPGEFGPLHSSYANVWLIIKFLSEIHLGEKLFLQNAARIPCNCWLSSGSILRVDWTWGIVNCSSSANTQLTFLLGSLRALRKWCKYGCYVSTDSHIFVFCVCEGMFCVYLYMHKSSFRESRASWMTLIIVSSADIYFSES